jgi:ABC-type nitrate/sulfonate/bicarbonate transport system substrate-binding protein
MTPFTFYLDWVLCAQFAGLCWAQAKGLYAAAGLDVTLVPWQEDGRSIVEKVTAGGLCAGSSEDNLLVTARAAGTLIKALATMLQKSPLVLITKPNSGIHTLADLPGRRVVMHSDGNRILEAVLALAGIERNNIEISESAYDLDQLMHDRVDAMQGYVMAEPIELAHLGVATHVIPIRHHQLHPYAQVFFASDWVIAQHAEPLQRFLHASFAGWRAALQQPDEATAIIVALNGGATPVETEREMLAVMTPYALGSAGLEHFGALDPERWTRNLATYQRIGILPRPLALAEIVDERFILS